MRFDERAQLPAGHYAGHGAKVAVPTAVLVGQQVAAGGAGQRPQLLEFGGGRGHRLFEQYVLAGAQGLAGQREVGIAGRVHHHQLDGGVGEQGGHGGVAAHVGVIDSHPRPTALGHAVQPEAGMGGQERRVK